MVDVSLNLLLTNLLFRVQFVICLPTAMIRDVDGIGGGLFHEFDAAVVGEGLVQLEGEGLTLADEVVR